MQGRLRLDQNRMVKIFQSYLDWLEGFDSSCLKMDIVAGLTVALVLIPGDANGTRRSDSKEGMELTSGRGFPQGD